MASEHELRVPDIGDFKDVPVIEVLVQPGDAIAVDTPVIVLETDKATMEVPATSAGTVGELWVKVGDRLNKGDRLLTLVVTTAASPAAVVPATAPADPKATPPQPVESSAAQPVPLAPTPAADAKPSAVASLPPASPMIRKLARELGVDLARVSGTGPRSRVLREDVEAFVRQALARPAGTPNESA